MADLDSRRPPSLQLIEGDVEAEAQRTLRAVFFGEPGEFERRVARKNHRAALRPINGSSSCEEPAG
jgi:hypothetical protein